ncbi:MAG: hypothetical protein F4120_06715 [Rhodothermaceae bacterium]|nr:hypothetical protein [Bacteroidota bacterium]MXW14409.1 hypothetical protein [Rhodothermaceae bacterium]MXW32340.1 hypothetical protein [Rhodothermaceae bacterium]MYC03181.1 hypothetical protein [Rhodothermaceae bacterium]MYE63580.1 hypothetical protein [Rhodothermaceae bacterium]
MARGEAYLQTCRTALKKQLVVSDHHYGVGYSLWREDYLRERKGMTAVNRIQAAAFDEIAEQLAGQLQLRPSCH